MEIISDIEYDVGRMMGMMRFVVVSLVLVCERDGFIKYLVRPHARHMANNPRCHSNMQ